MNESEETMFMKRWISLAAGLCLLVALLAPSALTALVSATDPGSTVANSSAVLFPVEDYEAYEAGADNSLVSLFADGTGKEISTSYNHTAAGANALRLPMDTPFGGTYARIPLKIDGQTVTAKKGDGYAVTFHVLSDADGVFTYALGTVATLSTLDGAAATAYTADEKHGSVSLKAGEWKAITLLAGSLKGPQATAAGETFYLTLGGGFAEGKACSVYLDDITAVPLQEWLDAQPALPQPQTAGLYTAAGSAVYVDGHTEYTAMRLYADYLCARGDLSTVSYGGFTFDIAERGILFGENSDGLLYGNETTYRLAGSTTQDFHHCNSYDADTGRVRYSMLVNAISAADRNTPYAYRTYVRVTVDGGSYVLYSAIRRDLTVQKLYDNRDMSRYGQLGWFTGFASTDGYNPGTDAAAQERLSLLNADGTAKYRIRRQQYGRFLGSLQITKPTAAEQAIIDAAQAFSARLSLEMGTPVTVAKSDTETYEIVWGAVDGYSVPGVSDGFVIKVSGNTVFINAADAAGLTEAAEHFITIVNKYGGHSIPTNYEYTGTVKTGPYTLNGTDISRYVIRVEKYPTYMVQRAAEALQARVYKQAGYLLPILPMTDAMTHYDYEIQVGPMNGSVKVHRLYDTAFTVETTESVGQFAVDDNGFIHGKGEGYYEASFNGKHLVINGGSSYAVDAAMQLLLKELAKSKVLAGDYTLSGTYATGSYSLSGGYDLAWQEEFNYDTSRPIEEVDKEVREYWTISTDGATGPKEGVDEDGNTVYGRQFRPGVYGKNWWIWTDPTDNGYLLQITKRADAELGVGFEAGRLISLNKWAFRYGIWETRIVMGTRNGSCSAIWASSGSPDSSGSRNEIDVYENFGRDMVAACFHTWSDTELAESGHTQHNGTELNRIQHNKIYPVEGEYYWDTFHSMSIEWTPNGIDFYLDGTKFDRIRSTAPLGRSVRKSTTIKFANGVGTSGYCSGYDPIDWMNEAYTAETGKTMEDFFEVQTVDYSRIYQTSNRGKPAIDQSYFKYAGSHPSSEHYSGYLKTDDSFVSVQAPQ